MKIEKIQVNNFRGFKGEHIIDFDPNLNVFVGRNGAGKSSILDAVGIGLCWFLKELNFIEDEKHLSLFDINNEVHDTVINLYINDAFGSGNGEILKKIHVCDGLSAYQHEKSSAYLDSKELIINSLKNNIEDEYYPLPIIRYFKFSPLLQKKSNQKTYRFPQFEAYKNAFSQSTDFQTFTDWFTKEENEENRTKVKNRDFDYINLKLSPVRAALEKFFTYFPDSVFTNLLGSNKLDDKISSLNIQKNGRDINIQQLSDGERQVILYVADIAARLSMANQKFILDPTDINYLYDEYNQGYGVVLIDEIEAHLHPEWQRNIIPALCGTFPNIQFFVTTHSPQVVSNVKREHIKIIENFKIVENTPHTYGRDANNILYNIFGVEERLPQIQAKFNKLYDLIDDENTNGEAKKLMQEIKTMLGEDDPEVQRAKTYLDLNT